MSQGCDGKKRAEQATSRQSRAAASTTKGLTFNNTRNVKVHGVEAEAEQRWTGGRRLRAAYGWQQAHDSSVDAALTNSKSFWPA
eukprot:gene47242-64019_t